MVLSPAALLVGHPGHELRLHHWLELAHPLVFVITDGSGSGRARTEATRGIVGATGCTAGPIFGRFRDAEIYRFLLDGHVDPVAAMTVELRESLAAHGIRSLVADPIELYNPTHDLCAVVAGLAVSEGMALYDYALTEAPAGEGEVFELDAAALARKLAAAGSCEELQAEVDGLLARIGTDALRREILQPAGAWPKPAGKPFYERHGEERVAAGRYRTVIRYKEHFRPFVEKLTTAVRAAEAPMITA